MADKNRMDAELQQLKSKLRTKPQERDEKVRLTANIPAGLWQRCTLYATILESDTSYVVCEALRLFFEGDKAFTDHVRSNPESLPASPESAGKKKGTLRVKAAKRGGSKKPAENGSPIGTTAA